MTKQERLAGLMAAIRGLDDRSEEFSCNAVQHKVGIEERIQYAQAMRPKKSQYTELHVEDILAVAPYDEDAVWFNYAVDFRVWLVSMYYGYVASGAQDLLD